MNFTEHVKIRNENFGTVIFETLTEKIFITNEAGGKILQFIGQGLGLEQILGKLQKVYIESPQVKEDTMNFINCLKSNNFIAEK